MTGLSRSCVSCFKISGLESIEIKMDLQLNVMKWIWIETARWILFPKTNRQFWGSHFSPNTFNIPNRQSSSHHYHHTCSNVHTYGSTGLTSVGRRRIMQSGKLTVVVATLLLAPFSSSSGGKTSNKHSLRSRFGIAHTFSREFSLGSNASRNSLVLQAGRPSSLPAHHCSGGGHLPKFGVSVFFIT